MYARLAGKEETEDLFRDTPALHFYTKTLEEAYPGIALEARIPVYLEHFIDAGEQVEKVTRDLDMSWWDTAPYRPLPDWHPCPAHEDDSGEYDLFLANTKAPLLSHTINAENPWINDICLRNRMDYRILLHTRAAAERGIRDGDFVYVESRTGRVKGRVRVTEGVHPEVLGTIGTLGHWAKQKPISRGHGAHSNSLIASDWSMVDPLSGQIDTCARVRVYRAED
jgi:anaerobic selenocysteine-containing dehydrogenase